MTGPGFEKGSTSCRSEKVVKSQKKYFVCPACNARKCQRFSDQSTLDYRIVKVSRICKKCTGINEAKAGSIMSKPRSPSAAVTAFHPRWTHYCFLMSIYLVFTIILYMMTISR